MNTSNSLSRILNSIQPSHSEHIILHTLLYPVSFLKYQMYICIYSPVLVSYYNILYKPPNY